MLEQQYHVLVLLIVVIGMIIVVAIQDLGHYLYGITRAKGDGRKLESATFRYRIRAIVNYLLYIFLVGYILYSNDLLSVTL